MTVGPPSHRAEPALTAARSAQGTLRRWLAIRANRRHIIFRAGDHLTFSAHPSPQAFERHAIDFGDNGLRVRHRARMIFWTKRDLDLGGPFFILSTVQGMCISSTLFTGSVQGIFLSILYSSFWPARPLLSSRPFHLEGCSSYSCRWLYVTVTDTLNRYLRFGMN